MSGARYSISSVKVREVDAMHMQDSHDLSMFDYYHKPQNLNILKRRRGKYLSMTYESR